MSSRYSALRCSWLRRKPRPRLRRHRGRAQQAPQRRRALSLSIVASVCPFLGRGGLPGSPSRCDGRARGVVGNLEKTLRAPSSTVTAGHPGAPLSNRRCDSAAQKPRRLLSYLAASGTRLGRWEPPKDGRVWRSSRLAPPLRQQKWRATVALGCVLSALVARKPRLTLPAAHLSAEVCGSGDAFLRRPFQYALQPFDRCFVARFVRTNCPRR